jgi:transcriptional regulator with XRE-family HTH domain
MKKEGIPGDPEVAKRLKQARVGANLTQAQLADRVSALVGSIISRSIISRTEKAGRDAEVRLVWAVAQVTGESFDWLTEPLNKLRDFKEAIPGYLNPEPINRSRIDHALGDCIGCAIDRNFHVVDEWNYHDPITGQIELILDLTGEYAEAV